MIENANKTHEATAYGLDIQLQRQSLPGPARGPLPGTQPNNKNTKFTA